jgi:hypothetical protein
MTGTILKGLEKAGTDKIFDPDFQRKAVQEHARLFKGMDNNGLPATGAGTRPEFQPEEGQSEPANAEQDDDMLPLDEFVTLLEPGRESTARASNRVPVTYPPNVDIHPEIFEVGVEDENEVPIDMLLDEAEAIVIPIAQEG